MTPDLLQAIYEAALEPACWHDALDQTSRLVGGHGGHMLVWDERGSAPFSMNIGFANPDADRLFAEYYGGIDPRRQYAMTRPVGEWMACHRVAAGARLVLEHDGPLVLIGPCPDESIADRRAIRLTGKKA